MGFYQQRLLYLAEQMKWLDHKMTTLQIMMRGEPNLARKTLLRLRLNACDDYGKAIQRLRRRIMNFIACYPDAV